MQRPAKPSTPVRFRPPPPRFAFALGACRFPFLLFQTSRVSDQFGRLRDLRLLGKSLENVAVPAAIKAWAMPACTLAFATYVGELPFLGKCTSRTARNGMPRPAGFDPRCSLSRSGERTFAKFAQRPRSSPFAQDARCNPFLPSFRCRGARIAFSGIQWSGIPALRKPAWMYFSLSC